MSTSLDILFNLIYPIFYSCLFYRNVLWTATAGKATQYTDGSRINQVEFCVFTYEELDTHFW
jgi:hypothetical protein